MKKRSSLFLRVLKVMNIFFSEKAFEKNPEIVKFYTGLPCLETFMSLLFMIQSELPPRRGTSPFKVRLLTLMKLRHNYPYQHLAHLFGFHQTTVADMFKSNVAVMYEIFPVIWPSREEIRKSTPHHFVEAFGHKVAVIVDCFEIFIERPSRTLQEQQYHEVHDRYYTKGSHQLPVKGLGWAKQ